MHLTELFVQCWKEESLGMLQGTPPPPATPPKETNKKCFVILFEDDHGLSVLLIRKIPFLLKRKSKGTNLGVKTFNARRLFKI